MHRHWPTLTRPVFEIVQPRVIVEVGSRGGANTRHILEYCRDHGAHLHVIDPAPIGNRAEIEELLGVSGTHHVGLSLDVLPGLAADLYLLDGDHNWYTVYHELLTIESGARLAGRWPVCLLHDLGWPYGRRDGYYAPERIPAEYRQPHARRGLALGRFELLPAGGFNAQHQNATFEHGPRNGILTAAEDFVAVAGERWELALVPEYHGAGLLVPHERLPWPQVDALRRLVNLPATERERRQAAETARLRALAEPSNEDAK